jgi:hypothetical protein
MEGFHELIKVHGLAYITVCPKSVPSQPVLLFIGRSQNDDRDEFCTLLSPQSPEHFEPIDFGNLQAEQDNLGQITGISTGELPRTEEIVPAVSLSTSGSSLALRLLEDASLSRFSGRAESRSARQAETLYSVRNP